MQYAAAAGSNDIDVMKLMRDVLSTQETQPYITRCDHLFRPFCHPFIAV